MSADEQRKSVRVVNCVGVWVCGCVGKCVCVGWAVGEGQGHCGSSLNE